MTPGQRRALWIGTFAMAFIFFYEASGVPLVWKDNAPKLLDAAAAWNHWRSQTGFGLAFLALGSILTVVLDPRGRKERTPYHALDWLGLAVGLGLLAGTAYHSYLAAAHY